MRLLQMLWMLALVASGAMQLVCDGRRDKDTNHVSPDSAHRAMHQNTSRTGTDSSRYASDGSSGEASSKGDDKGGDTSGGTSSDAASENKAASHAATSNESDAGDGDEDNNSLSNETGGKPSAHRLVDVMNAWSTVKQTLSLKFLGASILLTFIKLYPEYQKYFSDLIGVPLEEMEKNKRFNALSVSFMYNLDSILDNLDDEQLVEILAKQVGHQFSTLGLSEKPFLDMRNLILHMVERYHKRYSNRFPLGIVESASHTVGWLWTLISHGFSSTNEEGGGKEGEDVGYAAQHRRVRPHTRRLHPRTRRRSSKH